MALCGSFAQASRQGIVGADKLCFCVVNSALQTGFARTFVALNGARFSSYVEKGRMR